MTNDQGVVAQNPGQHEAGGRHVLRLLISGAGPKSTRAVNNIRRICETYLRDSYDLEIIDVYQQPLIAVSEEVLALPLLVKLSPEPVRRMIGDMSDTRKVLRGLGIYSVQ
jgi:circadian clock protein KaiB